MAIDTPARIAILGAGPIGLEAGLYGRFLGYDVDIYDQGQVADSVRCWGHVRMFSPFGMNASPLGRAALVAQDSQYVPPAEDALLNGNEYVERYLLPLSQTDLLSDALQLQTRVVAVARPGLLKDQPINSDQRRGAGFRLLLEGTTGERTAAADVVIDASGTYQTPRWLGAGGIPALGERQLRGVIRYHLPDVMGADRDAFQGRSTLVIGHGFSAGTTVVALAELARHHSDTKIVWLTRHSASPPLTPIENDALPARARLTTTANDLAHDVHGPVRHVGNREVLCVKRGANGSFAVELSGPESETVHVDHIVAHVGYRPDNRIVEELQVHRCYATQGPMKLAARLLGQASADCLATIPLDADTLATTEPDFFTLGSKSYGRNSRFLITAGLDQIQQVYGMLSGRHDLNLYANMQHLLP